VNHPCPNRNVCPDDQPGANLSSEAPDLEVFIGQNTGWDTNIPPLGSTWNTSRCFVTFESTVSQQDADAKAASAQLVCLADPPPGSTGSGTPGPGNRIRITGNPGWTVPGPNTPNIPAPAGPTPPNGNKLPLFQNTEQDCSALCPDGTPFAVRIAAGQYTAFTQEFADSLAYNQACYEANNARICFGTLTPFVCFNSDYDSTVIVSGNHLPISISLFSGQYPDGLTATQATASSLRLKGTTSKPGNYNFTLQALDAQGTQIKHDFTIQVLGLSDNTDIDYPDGFQGEEYFWQFKAAGGVPPYTFAGGLDMPPGVVCAEDGLLAGVPIGYGSYEMEIFVTDSIGRTCSSICPITFQPLLRTIETCVGTPTSIELDQRTYRDGANSWTNSGLPPWMTGFNVIHGTSSVVVSGTPTVNDIADTSFQVTVEDSALDPLTDNQPPNFLVFTVEVGVLGITNIQNPLPTCHLGTPYSFTMVPNGALSPGGAYQFRVVSGSLPPGLSLGLNSGQITGTCLTGGEATYTAYIQLKSWTGFACTQTISITTKADYIDWTKLTWGSPSLVLGSGIGASASAGPLFSEANSGTFPPSTPPPVVTHAAADIVGTIVCPTYDKITPTTMSVATSNTKNNFTWILRVTSSLGPGNVLILSNLGASMGTFNAQPGVTYQVELQTEGDIVSNTIGGTVFYDNSSVTIAATITAPPN
jgi:hypothetical protein